MKYKCLTKLICIVIVGIIAMLYEGRFVAIAQEETSNDNSGVEVLTRGPIHEAFAEPQDYNAAKCIKVAKEPPAAIEEIAPDEKPEGDNVEWIPGYWSWDTERNDFIWVSGIWRVLPPGRSWVPGYWTAEDDGWVWTPGFWMPTEADEVEYISQQPPESLEVGPNTPAPSPDYLWTPGCWIYTNDRFAWRPGHWVTARANWVWEPSHYVWTPCGYVFIEGYWDWSLERRGVLFAPIYVQYSVYARPGFFYSPLIVIQTPFLLECLFISPNYHHYYFGDYYGDEYFRRGIRPWFTYDKYHHCYDPIFTHQRWNYGRKDSNWEKNIHNDYDYRRQHQDSRPPRTYSDQVKIAVRAPIKGHKILMIGAPLNELSKHKDAPIRFEMIDSKQRDSMNGKGKDLRKFKDERVKWESKKQAEIKSEPNENLQEQQSLPIKQPKETNTSKQKHTKSKEIQGAKESGKDTKESEPEIFQKVKIPKSPIFSNPKHDSGKGEKPPNMPEIPKPDLNTRSKSSQRENSKQEPILNKAPSDGRSLDNKGQDNKSQDNRGQDIKSQDYKSPGQQGRTGR